MFIRAIYRNTAKIQKKKKKVKEIKDKIEGAKKIKKEIEYIAEKDNLFELEQIDKTLDEKIEKYSQMYCNTPTYIMLEKEIRKMKKRNRSNRKIGRFRKCNL